MPLNNKNIGCFSVFTLIFFGLYDGFYCIFFKFAENIGL